MPGITAIVDPSPEKINHSLYMTQQHDLQPGTILWLPKKDDINESLLLNIKIDEGCFHHPVLVLFTDLSGRKATVLILTSFNGQDLAEKYTIGHYQRARHLPIFPNAKHADNNILLHLKGGAQLRKKTYVKTEVQVTLNIASLIPYSRSGEEYTLEKRSFRELASYINLRIPRTDRHVPDISLPMPVSTLDYQTHTSRPVLQVTEDTIPWMPDIPSPRLTDPDTFFYPPPDPVSQRDRRSALLVYESLSRTNQFTIPRKPVRPSYTPIAANSTFYQQPYTNPQRDRRLVHQTYELPRFETPPPSASEPESPSWATYIISLFLISLLVTTALGGRLLLYLAYWALEKSKRKWDELNGTLYLSKSLRFMRETTQKVALAGISLLSRMKMKMNIDGARMEDVRAWASRLRLQVAGAQLDNAKVWLYQNVRYEMLSRVFGARIGGSWRYGNSILGGN